MARAKIRGLDCSAPANKIIPLVLRAQVNAMCNHRERALNWKDPEGVHDMRVLSRRLRSTISDFRPYFRKGSLSRPKLRAIADRLGDVRDHDVALIALEGLAADVKRPVADGIELLAAERRAQRKKSRVALKSALQERSVEAFRKEFLTKLRTITIAVPADVSVRQPPDTPMSFGRMGVDVIKARLKDFNAASSCLYLPYDIKRLHELRILAKRLRYSIELFASCWAEELEGAAKEVAQIQTSLGELHDCDVWINGLGARLKRTARKATPDPEELSLRAGATWLLKHFAAERMEHYRAALARWEQWQADGFLTNLVLALERDSTSSVEVVAVGK